MAYINEKLFCDNPQCDREIKEDRLAFNKADKEIYHVGNCVQIAGAWKAMKTGKMILTQVDYLKREEFSDLVKKGTINLEKRLGKN